MQLEVLPDDAAVAQRAAAFIAERARAAVRERGQFTLAVSGGRTPWAMLRVLPGQDLPWPAVPQFQVDARIAPAGDRVRNLTHIVVSGDRHLLGLGSRQGIDIIDVAEAVRRVEVAP